jgi:dihydroorotate dehydrogenase
VGVSALYRLVGPVLRGLDPETAHNLTLRALELGLAGKATNRSRVSLQVSVAGLAFPNPVGLAAGFDKDARVPGRMLALGFGFVEVGSLTPKAQSGNPLPRIFRLVEDEAVVNRLGFNNGGMDAAATRLKQRNRSDGLIGVNIGKNKASLDAIEDYQLVFEKLAPFADYVVVNVSSPNTPGLRDLQAVESLRPLLTRLFEVRSNLSGEISRLPIFLKLAPDLAIDDAIAAADLAAACGMDGLVISNTTIDRPETLKSSNKLETGGLSGRPLFDKSTELLRQVYRAQGSHLPIIGVGGIASAQDAYTKIRAGASLVQLYSALIYQGPGLVSSIVEGLEKLVAEDGFANVSEAIGIDA